MNQPHYSWTELAFASKQPLKALQATFIAAPRELSLPRLKQLIKQFLPQGNLVIGLSLSDYIDGFAGQPQFRTLRISAISQLIAQVNAASPSRHIATLSYAPGDEPHIIAKDLFARYIFINGSWAQSFHVRPAFFELTKLRARYQLLSPFASEIEAKTYLETMWPQVEAATPLPKPGQVCNAAEALDAAATAGRRSFDHTFQTGVVLAKPLGPDRYQFCAAAWNAVVPYQTYAMHHGSARERHFSPPGDLNYYDTNHAEMALLVQAAAQHLELAGHTIFINLLPCPTCARILSTTNLSEIVYRLDHSAGYAAKLWANTGKTIRHL